MACQKSDEPLETKMEDGTINNTTDSFEKLVDKEAVAFKKSQKALVTEK